MRAEKLIAFALAGNIAAAVPAIAAGYGLREFSAAAMGSAFAGAAATGDDASYLSYNPATASKTSTMDVSLALIGILPQSSANYPTALTSAGTPAGGNATPSGFISNAFYPELALRARLSDNLVLGLAISAPWGLSTNYPATAADRYYARQTKLMTIDVVPSITYQLTPGLSLSAGLQVQNARGTLTSSIDIGTVGVLLGIPGSVPGARDGAAELKAQNWAPGFTLGVLADISDNLTAGVAYRSQVHHNLNGTVSYTLDSAGIGKIIQGATGYFTNSAASAKLTTPDTVNVGLRFNVTPELTALAELDWTDWNKFDQLDIVSANPAQPPDVTLDNWKSSWFFSAGAEYRPAGDWSFKGGLAFDQSPSPGATENPRIPDGNRVVLAGGVTYRVGPSQALTLSYEHLFVTDGTIALTPAQTGNAARGYLGGTTQSSVNVLGIQFAYKTN